MQAQELGRGSGGAAGRFVQESQRAFSGMWGPAHFNICPFCRKPGASHWPRVWNDQHSRDPIIMISSLPASLVGLLFWIFKKVPTPQPSMT